MLIGSRRQMSGLLSLSDSWVMFHGPNELLSRGTGDGNNDISHQLPNHGELRVTNLTYCVVTMANNWRLNVLSDAVPQCKSRTDFS